MCVYARTCLFLSGHWAKIASEIPNRIDAQCMRTWRQMSKAADEVRDLSWREGNVGVVRGLT